MSSIVVIQQTDAIHFITDGASYNEEGVVLSIGTKVFTLPNAGCAVATRGPAWAAIPLRIALTQADCMDEVVDMLPALIRECRNLIAEVARRSGRERHGNAAGFEVTVGGWSDRWQRMIAIVGSSWEVCDPDDATGHSHMEGYESCVPWVPGQGYTAPPVDFAKVLGRVLTTQEDVDAIDPVTDGFALHVEQRTEGGLFCGRAAYTVGGFAELTTIRRGGMAQVILHEWPDLVGQKIQPAGAAPVEIMQAVLDAVNALAEAKKTAGGAVTAGMLRAAA